MNKLYIAFLWLNKYIRKNWFPVFAIVLYLLFAVYYNGSSQSILNCADTVNGIGDNTAGPIWHNNFIHNSVTGGRSDVTAFPYGENLSSPIDLVVLLQSLVIWIVSKLAGPICGYNLTNIISYIFTAMMMFGFILSLTKGKKWIALLAGYAVAFTPFVQIKVGGHPSYGFQGILIGLIWAIYSLIKNRRKRDAIILALVLASCFYFDPYFSLFAATLLIPVFIAWTSISISRAKTLSKFFSLNKKIIKMTALSTALFILLLSPLLYTSIAKADEIKQATAGTRDNMLEIAKVYSNMPSEYLLPFYQSPFFDLFGNFAQKIKQSAYIFSNGNITEDTVGISVAIFAVISIFLIVIAWDKLNNRKTNIDKTLSFDSTLIIAGMLLALLAAVILALPPFKLFGIPNPSWVLVSFTSTWRILSREYIIVNISTVILFSVALSYFSSIKNISLSTKIMSYLILAVAIFAQYWTYEPFIGNKYAVFSYSKSPEGYFWLKSQSDIKAIAEYPIEKATESNAIGYYLTMQTIHNKKLVNNVTNSIPSESFISGIKNLADPQTVPLLKSVGVDAVIIHGVDPSAIATIKGLEIIYTGEIPNAIFMSNSVKNNSFVIARVNTEKKLTDEIVVVSKQNRNDLYQKSAVNWSYLLVSPSEIGINKITNNNKISNQSIRVCFSASSTSLSSNISLFSDNRIVSSKQATVGADVEFDELINSESRIIIKSSDGMVLLKNLGCK